MQNENMLIGKRIFSARKDRHMTQSDLAEKCECSPKYISKIECGKKSPSINLLTRISSALEVTVDSLLVDIPTSYTKYYIDTEIEKKISMLSRPYLDALNSMLDTIIKLQDDATSKDTVSV